MRRRMSIEPRNSRIKRLTFPDVQAWLKCVSRRVSDERLCAHPRAEVRFPSVWAGSAEEALRGSLNSFYRFRSAVEIAKISYQNKRSKPLLEPL